MESLVRYILLLFVLFSTNLLATDKEIGRLYYTEMMGIVHKKPLVSSPSLTTIQCSHSLAIIEDQDIIIPNGWKYVKAGDDLGFIESKFLSSERPHCFQEEYPAFFSQLNLDLSDLYYWGKIYDQYDLGESKTR